MMTTTTLTTPTAAVCPEWCQLTPDDNLDDVTLGNTTIHPGRTFGPFLRHGNEAGAPGELTVGVFLDRDMVCEHLTPAGLRCDAEQARAAVQWLEASPQS